MLYNTQRSPLRMRAYGREVQEMVAQAVAIEDRMERQAYALRIIAVMQTVAQIQSPSQEDYVKLWNHLAQLSDYALDVDYPCAIEKHEAAERPERLPYPQQRPRLRHYGALIENLLIKAADKDDDEHKRLGIIAAARRMREKLYEVRGDMPSNERIAHDIEFITRGSVTQQEALALIS